jgi:hypothetical protein
VECHKLHSPPRHLPAWTGWGPHVHPARQACRGRRLRGQGRPGRSRLLRGLTATTPSQKRPFRLTSGITRQARPPCRSAPCHSRHAWS